MEALKEFFIKIDFDTSGFDKLKAHLDTIKENFKASFTSGANSAKDSINQIKDAEKSAMQEKSTWIKQETQEKIDALKAQIDSFSQNAKEQIAILKGSEQERSAINKENVANARNSEKQITQNLKQNIDERRNQLKGFFDTAKKLFATYLSYSFIRGSVSDFTTRGMLADEASSLLGITPERFDNIAHAFNRFGVEATSMESQLSAFNKQIQQADKGTGRLVKVLENFGLTIYNDKSEIMDADEMLLSMSEQLKDFDAKTRGAILAMMGFDNSIQSAFSDGGEALMSFYKKQQALAMITEKDTKLAKKWTFQLKDLKDQMDRIRNTIARFLLPIFTKIAEMVTKFIEWIFKHKQAFLAILLAIGIALTPILVKLTAILARQTMILAPWIALGALIAGIILVFEDIYYYFKGYKSMTGEFVKNWAFLGTILDIIKPLIIGIGETIERIIEFFANPSLDSFLAIFQRIGDTVFEQAEKIVDIFFNSFTEIGEMWSNIDWAETFRQLFQVEWWKEQLNGVKQTFLDIFQSVIKFFTDLFDSAINTIKDKIKAILEPIKNIGKNIGGGVEKVKEKAGNFLNSAKGFLGFSSQAPALATNTSTNNYNNSNQNYNITAYGVTNETADKLGKSVASEVNSQQFQNGSNGRFK